MDKSAFKLKPFFMSLKIRALSVLLLLAWLMFFPDWSKWITQPPLKQKISISPNQTIQVPLEIRLRENYLLSLELSRKNLTATEQIRLFGDGSTYGNTGKPVHPGFEIPIKWEIRDKNNQIVQAGEKLSNSIASHTQDYTTRNVTHFLLEKGNYQATIQVQKDIPEFKDIDTAVNITFGRGQLAENWQFPVSYIGWVLYYPLIVLEVLLTLWLGYDLVKRIKNKLIPKT